MSPPALFTFNWFKLTHQSSRKTNRKFPTKKADLSDFISYWRLLKFISKIKITFKKKNWHGDDTEFNPKKNTLLKLHFNLTFLVSWLCLISFVEMDLFFPLCNHFKKLKTGKQTWFQIIRTLQWPHPWQTGRAIRDEQGRTANPVTRRRTWALRLFFHSCVSRALKRPLLSEETDMQRGRWALGGSWGVRATGTGLASVCSLLLIIRFGQEPGSHRKTRQQPENRRWPHLILRTLSSANMETFSSPQL